MVEKVLDPKKITTDPVLLSVLAKQGRFWQFAETDLAYKNG